MGPPDEQGTPRIASSPTAQDLKEALKNTTSGSTDRGRPKLEDVPDGRDFVHLQGLADHFRHKKFWSWFLMGLIGVLVVFQCVLLSLVGWRFWDFSSYEWLLPALLIQNFAQIIGLAVFVVRSLFKDFQCP